MLLRDEGAVVFGFSFFTVLEFITEPSDEYRSERVRRGELIKHICGQNAFPHPAALRQGAKFPNQGMWLGKPGQKFVRAASFRKNLINAAKAELAKVPELNRAQRREFAKPKNILDFLRNSNPDWGSKKSHWEGLPISQEIIDTQLFTRFIKGHCSDTEFENTLNRWLTDPAEFSRIAYDYGGMSNLKDTYFSESLDDIEKSVRLLEKFNLKIMEFNEKVQRTREGLVEAGHDRKLVNKKFKRYSIKEDVFADFELSLEKRLGRGRAGHFRHYVYQLSKKPDTFKRSDAFDLMQLSYAYDCDLFRCDKAMANTFRNFEPFRDVLVSRFEDLPARIERILS